MSEVSKKKIVWFQYYFVQFPLITLIKLYCHCFSINIINMILQGEIFQVSGLLTKLETRHGWIYEGCARCGTKARVDGHAAFCATCKKIIDGTEPKYILSLVFGLYLLSILLSIYLTILVSLLLGLRFTILWLMVLGVFQLSSGIVWPMICSNVQLLS